MELLLPLLAALLVGTGVFLVLSRAMIRLIIGLSMIAYGANLSILLVAGGRLSDPPLTNLGGPYVDPLPQALILTAIVIGFGTTSLLLVLAMRAFSGDRYRSRTRASGKTRSGDATTRLRRPRTPVGFAGNA